MWAESEPNAFTLYFNLSNKDPVLREIVGDKRFRFAASHAINREQISELLYLGVGEPAQVAPTTGSRFYHERLYNTATEYSVEKAKNLLDEMGLKKDADGFRLLPDGKKLTLSLMSFHSGGAYPETSQMAEMITENLQAIGLSVNFRIIDEALYYERIEANDFDGVILGGSHGTIEGKYLGGAVRHWALVISNTPWGPEWAKWHLSQGQEGMQPPPEIVEATTAYRKAQASLDPEEQEFYFKEMLDIAADNLWTIGTVTKFGKIVVVSPKLRNIPTSLNVWGRGDYGSPGTWFYEE